MLRPIKNMKMRDNLFVLAVLSIISFIYYGQIHLIWNVKMPTTGLSVFYQIIFYIFFFMFLWSFFTCVLTDPGKVPLYWGFFLDDPEHKKRRYCLICHIFKPERCHHCSACNRCVLNMDHHCPWINNCVGFYNRKFFILMLTYVMLVTTTLAIGGFVGIYHIIENEYIYGKNLTTIGILEDVVIFITYIMAFALMCVLSCFYKFHINLIITNMTTIENLDRKRQNSTFQGANFDMGCYYNWVQVLGKNAWLWPFPLFCSSGNPVGDGVVWPQRVVTDKGDNIEDTQATINPCVCDNKNNRYNEI